MYAFDVFVHRSHHKTVGNCWEKRERKLLREQSTGYEKAAELDSPSLVLLIFTHCKISTDIPSFNSNSRIVTGLRVAGSVQSFVLSICGIGSSQDCALQDQCRYWYFWFALRDHSRIARDRISADDCTFVPQDEAKAIDWEKRERKTRHEHRGFHFLAYFSLSN